MKFITKRQTAKVVVSSDGEGLDLQILPEGTMLNGEEVKDTILNEEAIEPKSEDDPSVGISKLVNTCLTENTKFRKIALYGAREGTIVKVQVKYLVE